MTDRMDGLEKLLVRRIDKCLRLEDEIKELREAAKTGVRCMEQRNDALEEVERLEKLVTDITYTAKKRKKKMHLYRDTLRDIGGWSQNRQDGVDAADAGVMMWRGCVAQANGALEKGGDAVASRDPVYPDGYLERKGEKGE